MRDLRRVGIGLVKIRLASEVKAADMSSACLPAELGILLHVTDTSTEAPEPSAPVSLSSACTDAIAFVPPQCTDADP